MCETYSGVETRVLMNGEKLKWFGVERSFRQGWPLSPLMVGMVK